MFHPEGPSLLELARQALSSTTRGYDLLAPRFEWTPFRTPDVVLAEAGRVIGEPGSIDAALDVCCGTGAALAVLRPLCRERLVGVDLSAGMLEVARERLRLDSEPDAPGPSVELVQEDALHLPFHGEFDVVTCFGAFGHIEEPDEPRFVANIAAALRPGGRFVFVTAPMPGLHEPGYWVARAFNAAMRVRNALLKPQFVMYYLTFTLERARARLEAQGFTLRVHPTTLEPPWHRAVVVEAFAPSH